MVTLSSPHTCSQTAHKRESQLALVKLVLCLGMADSEENVKYLLQSSETLGRYIVAGKDLEFHELVIDEVPLVIAPSGKYDWDRNAQRHVPICIGCLRSHDPNNGETFVKCTSCAWPLCSPDCPGLSKNLHCKEECGLFRSKGIIQTPRTLRMVYHIRSLIMKELNPAGWVKLLDLAEVSLTNQDGANNHHSMHGQDKQDYEYLTEVCGFENLGEETITRINGVKMVNGFGFCNTESDHPRFYGMALYFQVSMASHGCSPNLTTQVVFDPAEGFPMKFYTKCPVRKGMVLQIAYRDRWLTLGTLRRREKIYQDHKFWCQCARCADSTENGTNFGAVSCPNCCEESFLLPINSLDQDSLWKCGRCAIMKTEDEVSGILEGVTDEIEKSLENSGPDEICGRLGGILDSKTIQLLHRNNYLRVRAELEWVRHFSYTSLLEDEAWNMFTLLVERAQHCKSVYERLLPDWNEKNNLIDLTMGKAIYLYYVKSDRIRLLSDDLALDLMAIALKYLHRGLQNEDSPSEALNMAKKLCCGVTSRLKKLSEAHQHKLSNSLFPDSVNE